jgi:hypothetical protein
MFTTNNKKSVSGFYKNEKRINFRYPTNSYNIEIEVKLFDKKSNNYLKAKGIILNISKNGLLISLDVKNLEISQIVNYKIFLKNPDIVFEETGRIIWGMETENMMYYGIKSENMNIYEYDNDFYQYMYDNGLINKDR